MFHSESVDQAVEKYDLQKITLLREISIKTGIQVVLLSISLFVTELLCQACSDKAFFCASPADLDKGVQLWQPPQAGPHRGGHPKHLPRREARQPQSLWRLPFLPKRAGQGSARYIKTHPHQWHFTYDGFVMLIDVSSVCRLPKGGLWAHQRGIEPFQQCVWSHACGDLCLSAASGSTQLHHGWSPWGTSWKQSNVWIRVTTFHFNFKNLLISCFSYFFLYFVYYCLEVWCQ